MIRNKLNNNYPGYKIIERIKHGYEPIIANGKEYVPGLVFWALPWCFSKLAYPRALLGHMFFGFAKKHSQCYVFGQKHQIVLSISRALLVKYSKQCRIFGTKILELKHNIRRALLVECPGESFALSEKTKKGFAFLKALPFRFNCLCCFRGRSYRPFSGY